MRFIHETVCKLSVSNGSVNALSTSRIKTIFLLKLDFAAESTCSRGMISNLLQDRVAINIRWKLYRF